MVVICFVISITSLTWPNIVKDGGGGDDNDAKMMMMMMIHMQIPQK
jgi:hypothetical protein